MATSMELSQAFLKVLLAFQKDNNLSDFEIVTVLNDAKEFKVFEIGSEAIMHENALKEYEKNKHILA